jgi:hypothetical protein
MEAQHVIEELGEPVISYISKHEVIEVDHKNVSVRFGGQPKPCCCTMLNTAGVRCAPTPAPTAMCATITAMVL